ncbi:MAG: dehydrogenase [Cereibacter sphaeroides]|uniref:Dehydrogenase n=1 Tax=Cereibacter sphaeroides TaxID=1063 RepID=A0A2W5TG21_CERSP|nr:MAG: dehydrogenase [Cereibacter sphaeroides]
MRVVVCPQPHQIAIETRDMAVANTDEALLRIKRVGICGTDYHIYGGLHPFLNYPRVIGHEISAVVEQAPAGSGFTAGQLVVVNPYIACGTCRACAAGKPNCCMRIAVLGVHKDGGMAELLALPLRNLVPAKDLDADQAASVEFLAIGAHAVRRGEVAPGMKVLVIGAGPIGLGTALFASIAGAEVTIADRNLDRLKLVLSLKQFDRSLLVDADFPAAVAAATNGDGFDVVLDATGSPASMEASFAHVAHGGAMVLVGLVKAMISFDDPEFHRREMSLLASRNATREDFDNVILAIRNREIDISRLVTHRTTLDRVTTDLPRWAKDKAGLIKAMVEFE